MRNSIANLLLLYRRGATYIPVSNLTRVKLGTCKMESLKWNIVCWSVSDVLFFSSSPICDSLSGGGKVKSINGKNDQINKEKNTQHYSSFLSLLLLLPVHIYNSNDECSLKRESGKHWCLFPEINFTFKMREISLENRQMSSQGYILTKRTVWCACLSVTLAYSLLLVMICSVYFAHALSDIILLASERWVDDRSQASSCVYRAGIKRLSHWFLVVWWSV